MRLTASLFVSFVVAACALRALVGPAVAAGTTLAFTTQGCTT